MKLLLGYIKKYIITLRYIKLLSYYSAKHLQKTRLESHKHRYTYYYGFQVIYGMINKGLLLILLGLLFNILPQLLIVTASFVSLRIWIGGFHLDSYTKCSYFSLISFSIMALLAKYISLNEVANILIYIFVLAIILLYAPVENSNRPLKNNEKIKFKIISFCVLIVLFLINLLTNNTIINNSIPYGVLLSGIIALPIMNKSKNNVESC